MTKGIREPGKGAERSRALKKPSEPSAVSSGRRIVGGNARIGIAHHRWNSRSRPAKPTRQCRRSGARRCAEPRVSKDDPSVAAVHGRAASQTCGYPAAVRLRPIAIGSAVVMALALSAVGCEGKLPDDAEIDDVCKRVDAVTIHAGADPVLGKADSHMGMARSDQAQPDRGRSGRVSRIAVARSQTSRMLCPVCATRALEVVAPNMRGLMPC